MGGRERRECKDFWVDEGPGVTKGDIDVYELVEDAR